MQSSSLANWTARVQNQLLELLSPTLHSEFDPSEALTLSLDAQPSWTLIALSDLAKTGDSAALRTLALVLLRRFVVRRPEDHENAQIWDIIPVATQKHVQEGLMQCLEVSRDDQSDEERNNICKTASYIAEMDKERGHGWPQLESCLKRLLSPNASPDKHDLFYKFVFEYPMLLADTDVAEVIESMKFGLSNRDTLSLQVQAIKAAIAVLETDDRAQTMTDIIPSMLDVFPYLASRNEQGILSNALFAFLEIYNATMVVDFLSPYLSQFLPFVLSLLSPSSGTSTEIKKASMEMVASTAEMSPTFVRETLSAEYRLCTKTLVELMSDVQGEAMDRRFWDIGAEEDDMEDEDCNLVAEDALDRVTLALGGQYILPAAFEVIPSMLSSDDWRRRYAALSGIGTLAEGSVEEFKKDIRPLVQLILPALSDANPRIVYSAVYATAELCSYLEGALQQQHGASILPSLLQIISNRETPARLLAYTCAALVNYTEDLDPLPPSLLKHSNALFSQLLTIIDTYSMRDDVKMKAMSAVAQLAAVLGDSKQLSADIYRGILSTLWRFIDGEAEDDIKARAMDCATLAASSVDNEVMAPDAKRLITSLLYIQQTHIDSDDPCTSQVMICLSRMAEVMGEAFLPHVDAIIPHLLRQASIQAENTIISPADLSADEDMDTEDWIIATTSAGETVKVHTETLREKAKAMELLSSLAHSLGVGLTRVGNSENTTGEWTSYAESMLELANGLLAYEHDSDTRIAAASMLSPLVKAVKGSSQHSESYNMKLVEMIVQPLLSALAYEPEVEPLSALFSAASELVLTVPEVFSTSDAATFVTACREQVEELQRAQAEIRNEAPDELDYYAKTSKQALEYMSAALQAFIKITRTEFPVDSLFQILNMAVYEQLELAGEKEWALRLLSDLIQYASPAAMAWTAGSQSVISEGLGSEKPIIRHICAYIAGMASTNEEGLYAAFCQSSFAPLCHLLTRRPDLAQKEEVLAYDNVVSAVGKIISSDASGKLDVNSALPVWLGALPIRLDVDEMEPSYSLLLDLIAREHPLVSPNDALICNNILNILVTAINDPNLPKVLHEPLQIGFSSYLAKAPLDTQQIWAARLG